MAIGSRIRSLRLELGLTLPQLSDKAGVSIGLLSQLENLSTGEFETIAIKDRPQYLKELAGMLGIDPVLFEQKFSEYRRENIGKFPKNAIDATANKKVFYGGATMREVIEGVREKVTQHYRGELRKLDQQRREAVAPVAADLARQMQETLTHLQKTDAKWWEAMPPEWLRNVHDPKLPIAAVAAHAFGAERGFTDFVEYVQAHAVGPKTTWESLEAGYRALKSSDPKQLGERLAKGELTYNELAAVHQSGTVQQTISAIADANVKRRFQRIHDWTTGKIGESDLTAADMLSLPISSLPRGQKNPATAVETLINFAEGEGLDPHSLVREYVAAYTGGELHRLTVHDLVKRAAARP